jgi:hypothetical protein
MLLHTLLAVVVVVVVLVLLVSLVLRLQLLLALKTPKTNMSQGARTWSNLFFLRTGKSAGKSDSCRSALAQECRNASSHAEPTTQRNRDQTCLSIAMDRQRGQPLSYAGPPPTAQT